MPKATLPTTMKGWLVTLGASMVGFIAGFMAIKYLERWI